MKVRLSLADLDEWVYETNLNHAGPPISGLSEQVIEIDADYGKASMRHIEFEGVYINYGHLQFVNHTILKVKADDPFIEMHFALCGDTRAHLRDYGMLGSFSENHHNVMYAPYFDGTIELASNKNMKIFEVGLSLALFERLADNESSHIQRMLQHIQEQRPALFAPQSLPITPRMMFVISEIIHCQRTGYLKRLFIEAKVIELFMMQVEAFEPTQKTASLSGYDHDQLQLARSIIESRLDQPFSLIELAREVGLNDSKLKRGFKEAFGDTVFGYLHDLKMVRAKEMLFARDVSIQEVARLSGYKNQTHFTSAFKRKFGVTPSKLRK